MSVTFCLLRRRPLPLSPVSGPRRRDVGFPRPGPGFAESSLHHDEGGSREGGPEAAVEVAADTAEQGGGYPPACPGWGGPTRRSWGPPGESGALPQGQVRLGGQLEELRPQRTVTPRPLTPPHMKTHHLHPQRSPMSGSCCGRREGQVQPLGAVQAGLQPQPGGVLSQRLPGILAT